MKACTIGLIAVGIQAVLAIPHRHNHAHFHAKRALVTATSVVTDVVTVTAANAVVWVDENGNLISTEYHNSTATVLPTSSNAKIPGTVDSSTTATALTTSKSSAVSIPASSSSSAIVVATSSAIVAPSSTVVSTTSTKSATATKSVPAVALTQIKAEATSAATKTGSSLTSGFAICYDLIDNSRKCKSASTLETEFSFLAGQGYTMIRIYDIGCDIGSVASTASAHGLRLFAGLNNINNIDSDVSRLVSSINGNWGSIDTINIGNEVINNGGSVPQVVAAVKRARALLQTSGFPGSVVTVDTFNQHMAHPELCAVSDYCAANAHAYFDPNTSASQAGNTVLNSYQGVVERAANGKRVVITESGWPYNGQANGNAVPSVQNQKIAMRSIVEKFANQPQNMFLFMAYNAGYKSPGSFGVEQFFGLYDPDHFSGSL